MPAAKVHSVPAVERVFSVLECLARSRKGFTVSELGRKLSVPKSSIHLILKTMERRGYLQKNPQSGKYKFGLKLVGLTRSALDNLEMREEARPFLQALVRKTGLTAHMAVLEGNEAVLIEKVQAPGLIQLATWIGRRMEVNCTGVGKALIAFLSEQELREQVLSKGLAKHNQKTIVSINRLRRELAQIREAGYALDDEEDEIGLRCIGVPVFGEPPKVIAAISVAGTTGQLPLEQVPTLARMVKQTAAEISLQLGFGRQFEAKPSPRS